MAPLFSIVVPVYNRAALVARALESCLAQDFHDYEIIVVDDGSVDGSAEVVAAFSDPRIRLLRHDKNRGVGPARNSGVAVANGDWIVCLDSDDELLPGALAAMARRAREAGEAVGAMRFMVRFDTGELSPDPPLTGEVWDYEAYIRWMEASFSGRQETLPVVRRHTFEHVRYSESRALEALYHLDVAKRYTIASFPDVVRLYHHDAGNQLTRPNRAELLRSAGDQATQTQEVLARHGDALGRWAPRRHRQLVSGLATLSFLAGRRADGVRAAFRFLRMQPIAPAQWLVLVAGLIGPRILAFVKSLRR
jgi:glycosyltransferase involved in cell wall biosynthesis